VRAPDETALAGQVRQGLMLHQQGRLAEAEHVCLDVLAACPDHFGALRLSGVIALQTGRVARAVASIEQAIAKPPDSAELHNNRGSVLNHLGRPDEALLSFTQATALQPDFAEAHWNQGACGLSLGEFEAGWRKIEWRWDPAFQLDRPRFPEAAWTGETPIDCKTILVHAEQGFGDSMQFCHSLPMLARRPRIVLEVQRPLSRLLASLACDIQIVTPGDPLPRFDTRIPMMSLPLAFRTTRETIPAPSRYLYADMERTEAWRRWLGGFPAVRSAWSGLARRGPRTRPPTRSTGDARSHCASARRLPAFPEFAGYRCEKAMPPIRRCARRRPWCCSTGPRRWMISPIPRRCWKHWIW
jgi:hypothetical protein